LRILLLSHAAHASSGKHVHEGIASSASASVGSHGHGGTLLHGESLLFFLPSSTLLTLLSLSLTHEKGVVVASSTAAAVWVALSAHDVVRWVV
jgi:hypothetical protein